MQRAIPIDLFLWERNKGSKECTRSSNLSQNRTESHSSRGRRISDKRCRCNRQHSQYCHSIYSNRNRIGISNNSLRNRSASLPLQNLFLALQLSPSCRRYAWTRCLPSMPLHTSSTSNGDTSDRLPSSCLQSCRFHADKRGTPCAWRNYLPASVQGSICKLQDVPAVGIAGTCFSLYP